MQIALVENANTENIRLVGSGEYWLTLPDGSMVSPVYAGWVGEQYRLCDINFEPEATYLESVAFGSNTGTNYVANDTLTVSGGVSTGNVAQLKVYSIDSNGSVTSVIVANSGFYITDPDTTDNAPTGGSGSGLSIELFLAPYPATKEYTYDANTNAVDETNVYGPAPTIDNTRSIELQRQQSLEGDSNHQNLKNKLRTATASQIDTWLQNNVTDLASARVVLGAIIKFLATKYDRLLGSGPIP